MLKIKSYININGSNKFKTFMLEPFTVDLLDSVNNLNTHKVFHGWKGKSMTTWFRFIDDNGIVLEFYPEYYAIKKNKETHQLIIPKTINDFINDMDRYNIPIYWDNIIFDMFEPKEFLSTLDIKEYYKNLLTKIGKSFELL